MKIARGICPCGAFIFQISVKSAPLSSNTDGHFYILSRREHGARLDDNSSTAHIELAVKSDPLVAVSETDLLACVVPCLAIQSLPTMSSSRSGVMCISYRTPREHALVVGSLDGLKLGRPYLPMVLLCERAPGDGHIATGIDERWYQSSSILHDNVYGSARQSDRSCVGRAPFFSIGQLSFGRPEADVRELRIPNRCLLL